jgi:hypothetical protein
VTFDEDDILPFLIKSVMSHTVIASFSQYNDNLHVKVYVSNDCLNVKFFNTAKVNILLIMKLSVQGPSTLSIIKNTVFFYKKNITKAITISFVVYIFFQNLIC